jgi:pimeloyl-ACP methyl ester carboxylesterase
MWLHLPPLDCESVMTPTLYEFGDSIEDWARGLIDTVGSGPFVLAGNSVGGSCALEIATLAPERVAAIILIGAKAAHRPEPEFRDQAIRLLHEDGVAAAWSTYWAPLFAEGTDRAVVESARKLALCQSATDIARGTWVFHTRPDRSEFVRGWDKPLAVVNGERDRPKRGQQLAASTSTGRFHLVEGCGHYVPLEQPTKLGSLIHQVLRDVEVTKQP